MQLYFLQRNELKSFDQDVKSKIQQINGYKKNINVQLIIEKNHRYFYILLFEF